MTGKIAAPKLFTQKWDSETMGVGGLDDQINTIFRRAFATRLLPPQFAKAIGAKHVRGILLHGPPGTGKTLIAKQIGKMLLAREPKVVNCPEVLNEYVVEPGANTRKLFAEAEEEQAKVGINSGLHVIIFDEIDALCMQRGNSASSSGVGYNVVNQLFSKLDGINALNNVVLIGITNRRDLIDEALLRSGRFEVQIEFGIPSKKGRLEIFKIHTRDLRDQNVLDSAISLDWLAEQTKNYTGAEIAGLVEAARSLAVNRVVKVGSKVELDKEMLDSIRITRDDFTYAMEHDIKPALGAFKDQLKVLARPMIPWDPQISEIQSDIQGIIRQISPMDVEQSRPYYVLLVGQPGSGLTTIAANMAQDTKFPFIRVYQARSTVSKTESAKVQYMEKLFEDASRSELSCIVLDGLEVIMNYCHIGPHFSNTSRAVFTTRKHFDLAKGRRMLVICTCNYESFLDDLMLYEVFDCIIEVPSLTRPEQVQSVLMALQESGDAVFTPQQCQELVDSLGSISFQIDIKKLGRLVEDANSDEPSLRVEMFLDRMHQLNKVGRK